MKKIILSVGVAICFISCGKEEVVSYNPTQKKEEIVLPKNEKKEENKQNQNQENNKQEENEAENVAPNNENNPPADPNEGVEKPNDYNIANRMGVRLKVNQSVFNKDFDYEKFFLENKTNELTATYLSQWVKFYSSTPGSNKYYTLTPEDIAQVTLRDIQYDNYSKAISFKVRYKNSAGSEKEVIKLSFDVREYFGHKIQVKPNFFEGKYMLGVYKYLSVFAGASLEDYDTNHYTAQLKEGSKTASASDNFIEADFAIVNKEEREITTISKRFSGFKPVSDLKNELLIASSYDLGEHFKKMIQKYKTDEKIKKVASQSISNWIKNTQMWIKRDGKNHQLGWDIVSDGRNSSFPSLSADHNSSDLDLYFERPIFSLTSIEFREKNLHIRVQLNHINDVSLEDAYFDFVVHNVK